MFPIFFCLFPGTNRLFSKVLTKFGLEYSLVDCTDLKVVENAIIPGKTKVSFRMAKLYGRIKILLFI